jgi:hypothetical protein
MNAFSCSFPESLYDFVPRDTLFLKMFMHILLGSTSRYGPVTGDKPYGWAQTMLYLISMYILILHCGFS